MYEVAVAAPVFGTLTYASPAGTSVAPLRTGIRVLVPLQNRLVTGYLLGSSAADPSHLSSPLKAIIEQLDPDPLFPEQLIPFFQWIADYYHYPLGEVIRTALPAGLSARSGQQITLTASGREHLPAILKTLKPEAVWMRQLMEKGKLLPGTVRTVRRKATARKLLKEWQDKGWIERTELVLEPKVRAKTGIVVCLQAELREQFAEYRRNRVMPPWEQLKKSEQKTLDLFFRYSNGNFALPRSELTRQYPGVGRALHSLAAAGLVSLEKQRIYRDPFGNIPPFFACPENLTEGQTTVIDQIITALDADRFQPFLLHGVTGSGKTEVYLRAAEHCLARQKNVLVLVPEIALASQLEGHFYSRFSDKLAVLHSGLSAGERFDQWQRILRGKAAIVIGARSAVFAPFADLGLVIVDEEHEPAYKQDDRLRYNGRDMAVLRARFADCPVLLGSATPSVTSFYHAEQGRYRLLTMAKRVHDRPLPAVEIIDLSKQKGGQLFFSDRLLAALHDNLEKGQQSLLFVNRRGYAFFMLCQDCGHVIRCRSCRVSLTHHQGSGRLICHYCGYSLRPEIVCPECRSGSVVGLGIGSERIEAEIRRMFPQARVVRLDSDTAGNRRHYLSVLRQIREQEIDILVGTQMVAKGLHFPQMTLVGAVWADSGLGMPDYKAAERIFQLLAQVTGRAGRGEQAGRVIIQTHQPDHYVLECARTHAYKEMYRQEKELRRSLGYPLFGRLVNIRFSGEQEEQVAAAARATAAFLRTAISREKDMAVDILGPAPAPLSMLRNRFRWHLLLKSGRPEQLHLLCNQLVGEKQRLCNGKVRMGLDVAPENMM